LTSAAVRDDGEEAPPPSYGDLLRRVIDPARFPTVHASIAAGAWDEPPEYTDEDATFGLRRVLDGVEMLVERRSREAVGQ
jgi:hypothetical protein